MRIERSALVVYSAAKMFELVQDVPSYPQFLSWCTATDVAEQTLVMQKATLEVAIAGVVQRFTTINTLYAGERVAMKLHAGPFRDLRGEWCFIQLGEDGCKVSLSLEFEMKKGPMAKIFGKGFGKVADRLVDDFCKRAERVYQS